MGNAVSSNNRKKQQWNWNFKDGRAQIKPRAANKTKQPRRPLFKKQPSNDYNLWIFNPDPPRSRR